MRRINAEGGTLCHDGVPVVDLATNHLALSEIGVEAVRRVSWSVSAMKAQHGCRARWAVEKLLPFRLVAHSPAHYGSLTHEALERLYQHPQTERTHILGSSILHEILQREVDSLIITADDTKTYREVISANLETIFHLEDPTTIDVYGTETWVKTTIDDVPVVGAIDRIDRLDDCVRIVDYKTGKRPNLRFGDDHGDQIRLYASLVPEYLSLTPTGGRLYYVTDGSVRDVRLNEDEIQSVRDDMVHTWAIHQEDMDRGYLPYDPGPLCAWCPLANICPSSAHRASPRYLGALSREECFPSTSHVSLKAPADTSPSQSSHYNDMNDMCFVDAKPWDVTDDPNAASPAITGWFYLVSLALDELTRRSHETGTPSPTMEEACRLAETFQWMCRGVGEKVKAGSPNHSLQTRLRGGLASCLKLHPIPNTSTPKEWKLWAKHMIADMNLLLTHIYEWDGTQPSFTMAHEPRSTD